MLFQRSCHSQQLCGWIYTPSATEKREPQQSMTGAAWQAKRHFVKPSIYVFWLTLLCNAVAALTALRPPQATATTIQHEDIIGSPEFGEGFPIFRPGVYIYVADVTVTPGMMTVELPVSVHPNYIMQPMNLGCLGQCDDSTTKLWPEYVSDMTGVVFSGWGGSLHGFDRAPEITTIDFTGSIWETATGGYESSFTNIGTGEIVLPNISLKQPGETVLADGLLFTMTVDVSGMKPGQEVQLSLDGFAPNHCADDFACIQIMQSLETQLLNMDELIPVAFLNGSLKSVPDPDGRVVAGTAVLLLLGISFGRNHRWIHQVIEATGPQSVRRPKSTSRAQILLPGRRPRGGQR